MANKRSTKKQIRILCGALAGEILAAASCSDSADVEKVAEIVTRIARLQVKSLAMCNFSFDKTPRDYADPATYHKELSAYNRQAYKRLREVLNKEVEEILKEMNAAVR